jgi:hypothetical protein
MDLSTSPTDAGVDPGQTPHTLVYVANGLPIGITADTPDIFLVAAAKDGDHQAYAELSRRHSKQFFRRFYGLLATLQMPKTRCRKPIEGICPYREI